MNEISQPMSVPIDCKSALVEVPVRPSSVDSTLIAAQCSPKIEPQSDPSISQISETHSSSSNPHIDIKSLSFALNTTHFSGASSASQTNVSQHSISNTTKSGIVVDTEVRIVFTGVTAEVRLAILQLLSQMPKASNVAPYRLVESVNEATHVITERLTRTFKVYLAVALGCPIVTAKWVQACVIRGNWLGR